MNYTRGEKGLCKLFRLEYRMVGKRKWWTCSLTMHDRTAIEGQAQQLAEQDNWAEWRVIEVA